MSTAVSIPRHPADVTAAWLSAALTSPGRAVEVTDVAVDAIGAGLTGAAYRVTAAYRSDPGGLPEVFVLKLPAADDAVRDRCALGYRSECAFYAEIADRVDIPVPRCFHCDISEDAREFALLLSDLSPAEPGDQIAGCDRPGARLAVRALAGLHGPTWCRDEWLRFPGLAMTMLDADGAKGMGDVAVMSADLTVDKFGGQMSREDVGTLKAAMALVTPWLLEDFGRFSLIHGDYRLDNMLFSPGADQVWAVDWQTLGVGLPSRDLAYFCATSLDPELRSAIEEELVADYHRVLSGYGVTGYDLSTCWRDYRYGMVQAPLITALGCAFATGGTDRGDDMFLAMLRRSCRAIRDLGTLDLIRELTD